ncbi:hypothetical protein ASG63_23760 [Methylobacterium sp. Leaf94]|uniref:hypothetical protein n=1 Tax=Methylobacterium sp. Leaf94 TaxID=1736250 RepID=UPI0007017EAE|nr:hypothetical protein [Methylobacterium sp. Leaf94]KQU17956.1 hypothetical protein ASG63_23760 [Methylobacterium sp. Leaf94]
MRFVITLLALLLPIYASAQPLPQPRFQAPPANDNSTMAATTGYIRSILKGTTFAATYLTDLTCATVQTTQLRAAIAATDPGGRTLLPPGCILLDDTATVTASVLEGVGQSRAYGTEIRFTSSAAIPAMKLMGPGARLTGVRIACTANRLNSLARGVQLSDGSENPRSQRIDNVSITDCYDQVDVQSGEFWSVNNVDLYRARRWGVRIRNATNPDSGDGIVSDSKIYTDVVAGGAAAIRLESGGGLKVSTTKTLQFDRSFDLAVADGADTSILHLADTNSFENPVTGEAVRLGRIEGGTTGTYKNIIVSAQLTGALGVYPGANNVTISTNTSNVPYGVVVQGGNNVNVTPATTLLEVEHGLVIGDPATNVTVGQFACTACVQTIEDNRTAGQSSVARTESREINISLSTSYKDLYRVDLKMFSGAKIEVSVNGIVQTVGAVNTSTIQLATRGATTAAMTQAALTVGGAAVDLRFDTASITGSVVVGIRPNASAGGGNFSGIVTIKVDGRITGFRVLP